MEFEVEKILKKRFNERNVSIIFLFQIKSSKTMEYEFFLVMKVFQDYKSLQIVKTLKKNYRNRNIALNGLDMIICTILRSPKKI